MCTRELVQYGVWCSSVMFKDKAAACCWIPDFTAVTLSDSTTKHTNQRHTWSNNITWLYKDKLHLFLQAFSVIIVLDLQSVPSWCFPLVPSRGPSSLLAKLTYLRVSGSLPLCTSCPSPHHLSPHPLPAVFKPRSHLQLVHSTHVPEYLLFPVCPFDNPAV